MTYATLGRRGLASIGIFVALTSSGCGLVLDAAPHVDAGGPIVDDADVAMIDASVDAAIPPGTDASLPDAALPDAALPDAAILDAAILDAELPDAPLPDAGVPPRADTGVDAFVPCSDVDMDGDHFSTCMGDCDDSDGTSYPGAPLLCGDGVVNDCMARELVPADEHECVGLYVATTGSDLATGTAADPFRTITHAIEAAGTAGYAPGEAIIHVQDGAYPESFETNFFVDVRGGFDDRWRFVPDVATTKVQTTASTGIHVRAATIALRNLLISQESADVPTRVAAVTIDAGASVRIEACEIVHGSDVRAGSTATGVEILGDAAPTFYKTDIRVASDAPTLVGISATAGARPVLSSVSIFVSGSTGTGLGQGTFGLRMMGGELTASSLGVELGSSAQMAVGLDLASLTSTSLFDVQVVANDGIPLVAGVRANRTPVSLERARVALGTHAGDGFGILLSNPVGTSRIVNGVFHAGSGPRQIAMSLGFESAAPTATTTLEVNGNVFDAGTGDGAVTTIALEVTGMIPVTFGTFYNNVFLAHGGLAWGVRFASALLGPRAFDHNAIDVGPLGIGHTLYSAGSGATTPPGLHILTTTCGLPSGPGDYHLPPGSLCIDAGTSLEVPFLDFDGERRDALPDIGADEFGGVVPTP